MKNILIDSDVILDFFFDRKPFSNDSAIILDMCEKRQIKGFVTTVIVSNIYYLLRKTANHTKVIESLKSLMSITSVITSDKEVIEKALNSNFKDFEDALQNYSAVESGIIDIIVTRNIKDYRKSEIAILKPNSLIKLIYSEKTIKHKQK